MPDPIAKSVSPAKTALGSGRGWLPTNSIAARTTPPRSCLVSPGAPSTFIYTVAKTGSPKIGMPVARIRRAAQSGGFGILTLAALALPLLEELQAAILDEDRITYDDLPHGKFEITTKEAVPRVILIEHPGETVVLHRQGSTLTVEHITNAPARMEELQAAQQGALRTFTLGQRDTFIERQQRADISQPTSTSSGGSREPPLPRNPSDTSPITTHLTATDAITSPSSTTDSVTSSLSVASNNSGTSNTILAVTNTTSASVLPPLTLVVADAPALSNVAASVLPPLTLVVADAPALSQVAAYTASYTEGSGVTLSPDLTVNDLDSTTLASASVWISQGFVTGDVLVASTAGTSITASYNSASGVLTLTGTDTLAHYQQVLDSVTYASTGPNPTNFGADLSRTINWVVNDGAITSNTVTSTVSITPVDDAPVIGNASNTIDYTELQALAPAIAVALTASDVDNTTLASASVSISIGFLAGDVLAVTTAGTAITASYDATSGVLALTGTDTLAHYQQVLDSCDIRVNEQQPNQLWHRQQPDHHVGDQ